MLHRHHSRALCPACSNMAVSLNAAQEAKAHDLAGDNPKDFDPFKDAERAAQKAAALAAATVNNLNLKDVSTKVLAIYFSPNMPCHIKFLS
jgi:hypothetical protein